MRPRPRVFVAIAAAMGVLASTSSTSAQTTPAPLAALCATGAVEVSVDFPTGGRHQCRIEDDQIILTVPPETQPINHSPWYAFRLQAGERARVDVVLDYGTFEHRYPPKYSHDGQVWRSLPPHNVIVDGDEHRARLRLNIPAGATFIAAQPIETPAAMLDWTRQTLGSLGFEEIEYGRSTDNRPLIGFVGGAGDELVVALTRQHPPETTGSAAFRAFVQHIASDRPEAIAFRETHRILLIPVANPDGVMRGHWRTNVGGIDLNRDWIRLTQPESRAMTAFILREAEQRRTVAFFDFHSTGRNVIYSPPLDSPSPTIGLLSFMRERFQTLRTPPDWSFNHSPDSGNSKSWALETLQAPGVTVELDDVATSAVSQEIGTAVAEALIAYESTPR